MPRLNPAQKHLLKTWIAALLWLGIIVTESSNLASADTHRPDILSPAALSLWGRSGSLLYLALSDTKDWPLRGLFHSELAVVPRLAGHFSASRQKLGHAMGTNFVLHDCSGCVPRRMAPNLPSQPHGKTPRRRAGQRGGTHCPDCPVPHSAETHCRIRFASRGR